MSAAGTASVAGEINFGICGSFTGGTRSAVGSGWNNDPPTLPSNSGYNTDLGFWYQVNSGTSLLTFSGTGSMGSSVIVAFEPTSVASVFASLAVPRKMFLPPKKNSNSHNGQQNERSRFDYHQGAVSRDVRANR